MFRGWNLFSVSSNIFLFRLRKDSVLLGGRAVHNLDIRPKSKSGLLVVGLVASFFLMIWTFGDHSGNQWHDPLRWFHVI